MQRSPPRSPTSTKSISIPKRLSLSTTRVPPDEIHTLDLSRNTTQTQDSSKITKIEGLEKHFNLIRLNLAGNAIKTIENLTHLRQLEILDLSRNSLTNSGVQQIGILQGLKKLSLAGNFMQHVPKCLAQLPLLEVLDLSGNNLSLLRELRVLSSLQNLHELSTLGNKLCALPQYRSYIVFTLRSLSSLDTRQVSDVERQTSVSRFAAKDSSYEQLEESLRQSTANANTTRSQHTQEHAKQYELLRTTQQLLEQRTSEWAMCNERMAELEQELAFYKIDQPSWIDTTPPLLKDGSNNSNGNGNSTLAAASTSLLSLLSPTFDWNTGKEEVGGMNGGNNDWVSPNHSPTRHMNTESYEDIKHVGLVDAVSAVSAATSSATSSAATLSTMKRVVSRKELEERAQGVSEIREERDRLAVQIQELEVQEEAARHGLNDAVRDLHLLDKEISELEYMSSRMHTEIERKKDQKNHRKSETNPRRINEQNYVQSTIQSTIQSTTSTTSTTSRKETAEARFGMSSRVQLDLDRQNLVDGIQEIDGLNKLLDALDLKTEATRDLLVCRTESLVLIEDREEQASKAADRMEHQLVDVHRAMTEQVRTLLSNLNLDPSLASTEGISSSAIGGQGLYDKGITGLTRESQHLSELHVAVETRLAECLSAVSDLEAAVLNQAQVVEEETDLVDDGSDDDGSGDVPSPRKRARSNKNSSSNSSSNNQNNQNKKETNTNDRHIPLTFQELNITEDPPLRPTSPASAMRQTLNMLDDSRKEETSTKNNKDVSSTMKGTTSSIYNDSVLPRMDGEVVQHHQQRVMLRARELIQRRRVLKEHVIVLERDHHQIHARLQTTENRWLRTSLEIAKAEARTRRLQFRALSKWVQQGGNGLIPSDISSPNTKEPGQVPLPSPSQKEHQEQPEQQEQISQKEQTSQKQEGVSTPKALYDNRSSMERKRQRPKTTPTTTTTTTTNNTTNNTTSNTTNTNQITSPSMKTTKTIEHKSGSGLAREDLTVTIEATSADATQFHFALRQLLRAMDNQRTLYGKLISTPDQFFDAVDTDDDGCITTEEFSIAMKRMDVELSSRQIQALMEAMDVQNGGTITYFELVNALRVEMRLLREEENHQRDVLRKEDYERRREALVLQRTREETFQRDNEARKKREAKSINQSKKQKRSALKKSKKSMPPSMERALRKRLLRACDLVGGVNWSRVFKCHLDKVSSLSMESFRSGMRRDGRVTIKVFDNPSVRDVFHCVDVDRHGEIDYSQFRHWLDVSSSKSRAKGKTSTTKATRKTKTNVSTSATLMPPVLTARDREEMFMIAVKEALREAGKDEKRIELVIGSLQYMLDNGQEEKARTISGKAFGGTWPIGLLFPPDAEKFNGFNGSKGSKGKEKKSDTNNTAATTTTTPLEKKKEVYRPHLVVTGNGKSMPTTTSAFGGGRSLPWENPSTPTRRDKFGNYTTDRKRQQSASRSKLSATSSIRRGSYFGSFPQTQNENYVDVEDIDNDEENERENDNNRLKQTMTSSMSYASSSSSDGKPNSSPPPFVTTSRRISLFGRDSIGEVVNANTSKGRLVYAKKNEDKREHERLEKEERLQQERAQLEFATHIEEKNCHGEVLYDVGSITGNDPNFQSNMGKSPEKITAQSHHPVSHKKKKTKKNAPLRTPAPPVITSRDNKSATTSKINMSIFGGSKFKPKARRERHNGSAVKADMYMREKYSKQMVNGLSEVLFK